ncbi:hypothetical protein [Kitasatospora sp. NPDC059327]|uniref:hypothetical protein n=1 Tax=Kitasatospora sp. NPDC059327 TaxID=3346803 RepID=UPI0036C9F1A6
MRTGDVVVGETYTAHIPRRLPTLPAGARANRWLSDMQLHLVRGRRITVTVIGFGEKPDTVVVSRDIPAGSVALRLTHEQAAALDLAEGQEYDITGIVTDTDGQAIVFPATVLHTIPARWLRPPGERLELHPDTDHFHRALVCRDADGMTPPEIDRAADMAMERLHHVQDLALDDPGFDQAVLTAEADRQEWLRIADRVRTAGLAAYDPRADPDAVEHPPLIRFRKT